MFKYLDIKNITNKKKISLFKSLLDKSRREQSATKADRKNSQIQQSNMHEHKYKEEIRDEENEQEEKKTQNDYFHKKINEKPLKT